MSKVTFEMDDDVKKALEELAVKEDRSFCKTVNRVLKEALKDTYLSPRDSYEEVEEVTPYKRSKDSGKFNPNAYLKQELEKRLNNSRQPD